MNMPYQTPLPPEYGAMDAAELGDRIARRKQQLGKGICILGHHYQRDEIIQFADFTGDSLKLSQLAASRADARTIVFCGVHFMAESADILSSDGQAVVLPHMMAGCAMSDMAAEDAVTAAIDELAAMTDARIIPITYVNSAAAIKAVTARAGGACCTSSNVRNVFQWALRGRDNGGAGGEKILAVPDEHLARNIAFSLGYGPEDMVVYDPQLPNGGISAEQAERAAFFLWKGHCYVHQRFTAEHVHSVRETYPDIRVIVHPECPREVVRLADASGSTEQIIQAISEGRPGSQWAVGTESNLVNRLAQRHKEMFIRTLSDAPSLCAQMARIDSGHLLWVLDNLAEGRIVNRVSVEPDIAEEARLALQRMIDIKAVETVTPSEGSSTRPGPEPPAGDQAG